MSLPPEVLDHIFSYLHSDFAALIACSLSHPFLSQLVEQYLYAVITLCLSEDRDNDNSGYAPQPHEFNQLLSTNPRISACVRSVKIVLPYKDYFYSKVLVEISSILRNLLSVKKIALSAGRQRSCVWDPYPEKFRQAILECVSAPSMNDLTLVRVWGFPLMTTDFFMKPIKRLTLEDCLPLDTDANSLYPLEFLSIVRLFETLTWYKVLSSWVKKCKLQSLALEDEIIAFDFLSDILRACSNTLTTLHMDIKSRFLRFYYLSHDHTCGHITDPFYEPSASALVDLSSLSHLKNLTISTIVKISSYIPRRKQSCWYMGSPIPAITDILKTTSSVENLALNLLFDLDSPVEFSPSLVDWSTLVRLLVESSASSFRLDIKCYDEEGYAKILSSFALCAELVEMVSQGVLNITPPVQL